MFYLPSILANIYQSSPPAPKTNGSAEVASVEPQSYPTFQSFPSAGKAVAYLIKSFNPDYLAFGEFHNVYDLEFKSSSERFADEIIPVLIRHSFMDLILESIPDGPVIKAELSYYKRTGKLNRKHTPNLLDWLGEFDAKGLRKIYAAALKMNLHGANLSLAQIKAQEKGQLEEQTDIIIARKTRKKAAELLNKGVKFSSFGGIYHNDINPDQDIKKIALGAHFNKKCSYLEVDLIVPEIFDAFPGEFKEKSLYRKLVPKSGVLLIRESKRKFIILFPYSTK